MAALSLLISSGVLQDGTAICLILCDLYYVLVYLSLPCHISSSVLFPDTDVPKTLRPFRVYFEYKSESRLFSSLKPQRTDPEAHLFLLLVWYQVVPLLADLPTPHVDETERPNALGLN